MTLDVNSRPLSDCRDEGRPNLGIISVRRIWATVWALLFVVRNASFYPSRKGVHKDQEVSDSLNWRHMSKAYLPILCWEAASHLMGWKGDRFKVGIGINTLTYLTGVGKVT